MKKFIVLSLLVSQFAFAGEIVKKSFSIFPNVSGNLAYYACDFVENKTEDIIEILGGTVLNVSCFGGISAGSPFPMPNNVSVKFDRPIADKNEIEVIQLKDYKDCHLVTEIVRALKSSFPIVDVSGTSHCFRPNDSYRIKISIRR